MQHFLKGDNIGLVHEKIIMNKNTPYRDAYITNTITDAHILGSAAYIFPLYLYPDNGGQQSINAETERVPNLNKEIVTEIEKTLCKTFEPIDLLDYIYAMLHSPSYRERYKEFLKIDFPRVPYPSDAELFWELAKLGGELRHLHLLEDVEPRQDLATFFGAGNNVVTKVTCEDDKVRINATQYFNRVPVEVQCFYMGGYQPAQKWLKDRKDRSLCAEDIVHYQKMIAALSETIRLMAEIDAVIVQTQERLDASPPVFCPDQIGIRSRTSLPQKLRR